MSGCESSAERASRSSIALLIAALAAMLGVGEIGVGIPRATEISNPRHRAEVGERAERPLVTREPRDFARWIGQ